MANGRDGGFGGGGGGAGGGGEGVEGFDGVEEGGFAGIVEAEEEDGVFCWKGEGLVGSIDWGNEWICEEDGGDTFFCGGPEVDGFGKVVHFCCWWWRCWGRGSC